MNVVRERQFSSTQGPWYPDTGVFDSKRAVAYIAEYFPDILSGPNDVGLAFLQANKVILKPKINRTFGEPFIATTGRHRLRFYHHARDREKWELQCIPSNLSWPDLFIAWGGVSGFGSHGVYGNYVDRLDFRFDADTNEIKVKSSSHGGWALVRSLRDQKLNTDLALVTARLGSGVRLKEIAKKGNLLLIQAVVGNKSPRLLTIPATVTPQRFA